MDTKIKLLSPSIFHVRGEMGVSLRRMGGILAYLLFCCG